MDSLTLPIVNWEAWAPGRTHRQAWTSWAQGLPDAPPSDPDTKFVDPMLRRRLGAVARMALDVAQRCLGSQAGVPMVFASRHGELARTVDMLRDIAMGEEVSPTAFSLSVHNAAAGVFCIARSDHAPATAIAAGDETFGMGLVEAMSRLSPEQPRVLLVYADAPVPEAYHGYISEAEHPHALALLLDMEAVAAKAVRCRSSSAQAEPSGEMMSLSFLRFLAGETGQGAWTGARSTWDWKGGHA